MALYENLYQNMYDLESFYRFEGYASMNHYDFSDITSRFSTNTNQYIYFSKKLKHHTYYTEKRLFQLISKEILLGTGLDLHTKTLCDFEKTAEIIKQIENYQIPKDIKTIEFRFCPIFLKLIKNNGKTNMRLKLEQERGIEIADQKRRGGGYGLCDDWLKLFNLLTILYSYRQITTQDVQEFFKIYRMHKLRYYDSGTLTWFLQNRDNHQRIALNSELQNSFIKYEIANSMERLIEQHLVNPNSSFGKNPSETIKNTVNSYERTRKRTLEKLEQLYEKSTK